jgi:hypothetical protein
VTFDLEEYRADLTRRRDAVHEMATDALQEYLLTGDASKQASFGRLHSKESGLQIALDLLPKEE